MLTIHVNGSGPDVDPSLLRRAVRTTLEAEGIDGGELSLTLLDDREIREMNGRYLGRDRVTDVISFSLQDPGDPLLADVYVGLEQARRQAADEGVDLREELVRLAVHGTLHAAGHDHPEEGRDSSPFFRRQEELVGRILAD